MTTREARDPVAVVRENLAEWEVPHVELDVFGTADAAAIVEQVDEFVRRHLGPGVAAYLFCSSSVGSTHGLILADGRRVVLKARPPPDTNPDLPLDRESLRQVVRVQRFLTAHDYPCPEPLLEPEPLGRGLATVETYLDAGRLVDGHDPRGRRLIAASLAEHIALLRRMPDPPRLDHFAVPDARLFPMPHGKIFKPSEPDTGWVRALARRARDVTREVDSALVLGHCDWRVEHLRFADERLVVSHDWDSLSMRSEVGIVGVNAHGHTADWSQEQIRRVPTAGGILGFIADYEAARGEPFTREQHRAARAWAVYSIAYGAWISIAPGDTDWPEDSWPALLRGCGEDLLR
ncbi:phosphotransferase [Nannocystis radixulma]|uniref:Phosphotransferase n=1 Tax=Nannocystis radixulma TaxID=2995305 RepID=A0ABT5BFQ0_9BACT|nr:phosphotransferase [Nannocystis radixulma]MDC0672543.1 phosphotransferase [Nannocystis radixulma]